MPTSAYAVAAWSIPAAAADVRSGTNTGLHDWTGLLPTKPVAHGRGRRSFDGDHGCNCSGCTVLGQHDDAWVRTLLARLLRSTGMLTLLPRHGIGWAESPQSQGAPEVITPPVQTGADMSLNMEQWFPSAR
jgi:hypothetical protein